MVIYYDTGNNIILLDRASFQVQNIVYSHGNYNWSCFFASGGQESACCVRKNQHQWKSSTFPSGNDGVVARKTSST